MISGLFPLFQVRKKVPLAYDEFVLIIKLVVGIHVVLPP